MAGKRERHPRPAGEILGAALDRWGIGEEVRAHRVFAVWEDAVGPQVAAHAGPVKLRRGVLQVHVDQNGWLQQLVYLKPLLLEKINERLGYNAIADVQLRLGALSPQPSARSCPTQAAESPPPLPPDAAARIGRDIDRIRDPALRDLLRRLLSRHLPAV